MTNPSVWLLFLSLATAPLPYFSFSLSTSNKADHGTTQPTTVYLIRHAESVSNVRVQQLKSKAKQLQPLTPKEAIWGWKLLLGRGDTDLTMNGQKQIEELREALKRDSFWDDNSIDLVVHSPLIRARETCIGLLQGMTARSDVGGGEGQGGDRPAVYCLDELEEVRPTDIILTPVGPRSPQLDRRIEMFQDWLLHQEKKGSRRIVVVGHSEYFKRMLKLDDRFRNCDMWQASFSKDSGWSNLRLLYRVGSG